jgi:hypothetical protein
LALGVKQKAVEAAAVHRIAVHLAAEVKLVFVVVHRSELAFAMKEDEHRVRLCCIVVGGELQAESHVVVDVALERSGAPAHAHGAHPLAYLAP